MGRGIAYRHAHFMLFEEESFYRYSYLLDANGDETDAIDPNSTPEWEDLFFDDFKAEVATAFGTTVNRKVEYVDREAYIFADNDRLKIGIDNGGGSPCLFVTPKTYELFGDSWTYGEKEYVIERDVVKAFNKLIDSYGKNKLGQSTMFRLPSSAWTSFAVTGYRRPVKKSKKKAVA